MLQTPADAQPDLKSMAQPDPMSAGQTQPTPGRPSRKKARLPATTTIASTPLDT